MPEPRPGGPLAGSEGSNSKQSPAGLHDDELLEKVAEALEDCVDDYILSDAKWRQLAVAAVAAVRGAGGQASVDSLASARGVTDAQLEAATEAVRASVQSDITKLNVYREIAEVALAAAMETREDTSASSNPSSGAVPLEPQEEKLRGALRWIEGYARTGRGADWDLVVGVARKALSAVPLLQDGGDDGSV